MEGGESTLPKCKHCHQMAFSWVLHVLDFSPPGAVCGLLAQATLVIPPAFVLLYRYFVMVTTPRRAYQFIGHIESQETPIFQSVLSPGQPNKRYLELPGEIENSVLSFFAPFPSSPTSFAWSAGCGISFGELDFRSLGMYRARPTEQPVETVLVGEPQLWPVSCSSL